ncbi:hypothetical protein [Sporomusa aerivorans]|uniref:hypothetical protein n=1 Tax=Sporomusa aerivorans TaxID=204936 RepID=UPI00352B9FCE
MTNSRCWCRRCATSCCGARQCKKDPCPVEEVCQAMKGCLDFTPDLTQRGEH